MKKILNLTFAVIRVIIPTLYLLMYLPIWSGKHLPFSFSNPLIVGFMLIECFALFVAICDLICLMRRKPTKEGIVTSWVLAIVSFLLLCFVGYIFYLNYNDLPIMPTPGAW